MFLGHQGSVLSVAFSPDGTKVLTGSYDGTAKLWKASDGMVLRMFSGHAAIVNSVAFSPDGTKVLTGSWDGTARLWLAGYDVRFNTAASAVAEAAGTVNVLLRLSKLTTWTVTVNHSVSGTATAGADYTISPPTVTFNPRETTKTISVKIINDTLDEPDETVVVTLTGSVGATLDATKKVHTLTILDNDPTPTVGFAQATGGVPKNIGLARIPVRLSAASGKTVRVNFSTANITATAGKDYLTTSAQLALIPGQTTATANVRILSNRDRTPKTLRLNLASPQNASLGTNPFTLTIEGDTALQRWPLYP